LYFISAGFFLQAGSTLFALFWMCHVLHVFVSLVFPIKFHKFSEMKTFKKGAFMIEIIFILLFGVLPSLITAAMSEYQYVGFPPICLTKSTNVFFYSSVLPISIIAIVGVCLLLGAFWTLRKVMTRTFIVAFQLLIIHV